MKRFLRHPILPALAAALLLLASSPARADDPPSPRAESSSQAAAGAVAGKAPGQEVAPAIGVEAAAAIPPGEEAAPAALESSPRHGEWVDIPAPGGGVPIRTWIVWPERKDKAPVVLVIHEIFGLTDWIRAVADRLAADGFIAVAPDLLSGKGPGGGATESLKTRDEVVALIRALEEGEVAARLDAVRAHALALPAASGKSASLGFCWGGSASFRYTTTQAALDAAVVFYGTAPADLTKGAAPVLGLYGGDDARVTATVADTEVKMKELGRSFTAHVFGGAGHGFLRQQDGREGANEKASREAWPAAVTFLRKHLE